MKRVQPGVRIKLAEARHGTNSPRCRRLRFARRIYFPNSSCPFRLVKPTTGGQLLPQDQIAEIDRQERRDLKRFDVDLGHQKTAKLLAWEIGSGQDSELQRFASDTLPNVLQHLDRAKALHAELTGAAIR